MKNETLIVGRENRHSRSASSYTDHPVRNDKLCLRVRAYIYIRTRKHSISLYIYIYKEIESDSMKKSRKKKKIIIQI